jgi:hypothetical protein
VTLLILDFVVLMLTIMLVCCLDTVVATECNRGACGMISCGAAASM